MVLNIEMEGLGIWKLDYDSLCLIADEEQFTIVFNASISYYCPSTDHARLPADMLPRFCSRRHRLYFVPLPCDLRSHHDVLVCLPDR